MEKDNEKKAMDSYKYLMDYRKEQLERAAGLGLIPEMLSTFSLEEKYSGMYRCIFMVDEEKKAIIVINHDNENETGVFHFGHKVLEMVNMLIAFMPGSTASELLDKAGFTDSEKEQATDMYKKNEPYLKQLYYYLLHLSEYDIGQRISIYNTYRFFGFNDLWLEAQKLSGSTIYENAMAALCRICEHGIAHSYEEWTVDGVTYSGRTYHCKNIDYWFSVDLFQLLINGSGYNIKKCSRCGRLFVAEHGKSIYCNFCKRDYGKIRSEARKKNHARYLHKRVQDKLNQQKKDTAEFINESNYYWDKIRNKITDKTPPALPHYKKSIKTEKQYIEWLEKKLKE